MLYVLVSFEKLFWTYNFSLKIGKMTTVQGQKFYILEKYYFAEQCQKVDLLFVS